MSLKQFLIIALVVLSAGFLSGFCKIRQSADTWYEETKAEILKQSALKPDSMALLLTSNKSFKKELYFSKGRKILTKSYKKGVQCSESYFSNDGDFELRRELCENGVVSFEGIAYQTSLYGPFTQFYCNGKIQQKGSRYKSEKIGTWQTFDETGKLMDESNLKYHSLLNSLPQIEK